MIKRIVLAMASVMLLSTTALPAVAANGFNPPGTTTVDPGQATLGPTCNAQTGGVIAFLALKSWDECLKHDSNGVPQITSLDDIWRIGIIVVETLIKIAGYLAVGFIIWGGIKYLKSQGEPSELTAARQIITNALIGFIICMVAVSIIELIAGTF